ncbi:peroxiredoxin-like family protein [Pseudodesulfovibrio sediminis]|uniref:thioredoxin-dependent peroxiredoxin n=1 Tax=Pseudodesulfovibrio sediminis TaxID=2810563 RepID=A0ABN6ENR3_9BACT|nr:peroxiredoxin-like family protein [Pseudodesulfovibrio sediminis]BCS87927.1 peroxiredoxin [Pseudodesulfovibrio sediminis]
MTDLNTQITKFEAVKKQRVSADDLNTMEQVTQELKAMGVGDQALKDGEQVPDFTLRNHKGEARTLAGYCKDGPVVFSFYRGGWCPYCNLELAALQRELPAIKAVGAQLVAITPEVPDESLSVSEKDALPFDILFDKGNTVAESFGLAFVLPEKLRPIYARFGIDIPASYGDDSFKLPVTATYIIKTDGSVASHFADVDHTKRLEPAKVVEALKQL